MIDCERRNQYAEQLRHFAAGVLSVTDYEERTDDLAFGNNEDEAVYAVWRNIWCLYDDFRTERLRGDWALSKETRLWIAYSILFLYSDAEYRWPPFRPDAKSRFIGVADDIVYVLLFPLDVLTVKTLCLQDRWYGLMEPFRKRQWEQRQQFMRRFGDVEFWPFLYREEYEAAVQTPKFFAGAASAKVL